MATGGPVPELDCYLVRDLLIPYAAGDASQPTRAWVERHVSRCSECRCAFEEVTGTHLPVAAPPPPPSAGQHLMRRVRAAVRLVVALILLLALGIGGLIWTIGAMKRVGNIPDVHPVPADSTSAREAVTVDLTAAGLHAEGVSEDPQRATGFQDGAVARFTNQVQVWAYRFEYARQARLFGGKWEEQFESKAMSMNSRTWDRSAGKFRSGGNYYYTWSNNGWFIVIAVPESVPEPAELRDQIRDLLFIAYSR